MCAVSGVQRVIYPLLLAILLVSLFVWRPFLFTSCSLLFQDLIIPSHERYSKLHPVSQLVFSKVDAASIFATQRHVRPSSTRDCLISRTPGQHLLFEQMISDFKSSHPGATILVVFPAANSEHVIADMTDQLIQLSQIFGHRGLFVTFGMDEIQKDDTYFRVAEVSKALDAAHVFHRVQFTTDLETWTHRTLLGHMVDFEIAVVLRGVICASDLARLIVQTVENSADMACAVDLQFSPHHLVTSSSANRDYVSGAPIHVNALLYSRRFMQVRCCDGPVKVYRMSAFGRARLLHFLSQRQELCPNEEPSAAMCSYLNEESRHAGRIMISPSVKASYDPEDFRSALQLGFMGLQGYDYRSLEWGVTRQWTPDTCY